MTRTEYNLARSAYKKACKLFDQQEDVFSQAEKQFKAVEDQWDKQVRAKRKAEWESLSEVQRIMRLDETMETLNNLIASFESGDTHVE